MAKVVSLFQLRGTIDEVTFRKTAEGIIAGMKPGPRRERVLTHENFRRTRRNAAEFQLAIREARLMRHALGSALNGKVGSALNGRMNGLFYTIARTDRVSDLGCRQASAGDIGKLTGFEFNKTLSLDYALPDGYEHSLDVHTGRSQVAIPSFIARKRKDFPPAATHFRIVSALVSINFEQKNYRQDIQQSDLLPLRKKTPGAICFEHAVAVPEGAVVAQVLGMEFYAFADGQKELVKGGAIQLVEVRKEVGSRRSEVGRSTESGVERQEAVSGGNEAVGGKEASRGGQRSEEGGPGWKVVEVERMADFKFGEEEGSQTSEVGSQKKNYSVGSLTLGVERRESVGEGNEATGGKEASRESECGVGSQSGVERLEVGVEHLESGVESMSAVGNQQEECSIESRVSGDGKWKTEIGGRPVETGLKKRRQEVQSGKRVPAEQFAGEVDRLIGDAMAVGADWLAAVEEMAGWEIDTEAAVLSG